jgi:hypothetical protein
MKKTPIEALKHGEKYYFTGKPCVNGHISKRTTLGGKCVECREEMRIIDKQNQVKRMMAHNKIVNDRTREEAVNACQTWTTQDIAMVTEKDENGHYVLRQEDAAIRTGRSFSSIQHVRSRHLKLAAKRGGAS